MKLNEFITAFASEHKVANIDDVDERVIIMEIKE